MPRLIRNVTLILAESGTWNILTPPLSCEVIPYSLFVRLCYYKGSELNHNHDDAGYTGGERVGFSGCHVHHVVPDRSRGWVRGLAERHQRRL